MGLQIAIAVLGRFREARLDLYVSCLESSLQQQLQPGEQIVIPENATFPVSQCTMEWLITLSLSLSLSVCVCVCACVCVCVCVCVCMGGAK